MSHNPIRPKGCIRESVLDSKVYGSFLVDFEDGRNVVWSISGPTGTGQEITNAPASSRCRGDVAVLGL